MDTIDPADVRRVLTGEQLRRGAAGLSYRAEQLAFVTMLSPLPRAVGERGARAIWNARIESVLVHGRALSYFLRANTPAKGDLHYTHYSKSVWSKGARRIDEIASKIIDLASTHLAHASIGKPGWEPHPGEWPLAEIAVVCCYSLRDFVLELSWKYPERAALFGDRPDQICDDIGAQFPGLQRTRISDHPEVGDLSSSLQRFIGFED